MLVQVYTLGKTDKILWDNLAEFLKTQLPKMGSLQLYCQMVTKNSLLGCKQRSEILKRKEITIFNYVRRLLCLSCPTAFASASSVLLYHVIVKLQKEPIYSHSACLKPNNEFSGSSQPKNYIKISKILEFSILKGQMNQKIDIFFVALPSTNTKKNHPK